jgi:hypothetical protein
MPESAACGQFHPTQDAHLQSDNILPLEAEEFEGAV